MTGRALFLAAALLAAAPDVRSLGGAPIRPPAASRIVSVAPALTETLFALGAGARLVAVSDFCNFPAAARGLPRVGGVINLDVEKVVALRPTLVVATSGSRDQWRHLERVTGAPVYVAREAGIAGLKEDIANLGYLAGRLPQAADLTAGIDRKLRALHAANRRRARPAVFYMVWDDPLMTAGQGSYLDELITAAGGRNVAGDKPGPYPRMSWEDLLARRPAIVAGTANLRSAVEAAGRRLGAASTAVMDEDVVSRPGPRVVEALDLFERAFHRARNKPLKNTQHSFDVSGSRSKRK